VGKGRIEPFPLRDARPVYSIWCRGTYDYEVTISYIHDRHGVGQDSRTFSFRSIEACRAAIPPGLERFPLEPGDHPDLVEAWS
jgi:hypothetical protein